MQPGAWISCCIKCDPGESAYRFTVEGDRWGSSPPRATGWIDPINIVTWQPCSTGHFNFISSVDGFCVLDESRESESALTENPSTLTTRRYQRIQINSRIFECAKSPGLV